MGAIKKIINKYKAIPVVTKVAIWFAICSILQKGISFITVPIFTRLMTPEQYGQFSVYNSWHQIIAIFATLNLSYGVFNNGMTKYPDDRDKYTSSMQGLSTLITLVLFVIYLPLQNIVNGFTGLSTMLMLVMFADILTAPALAFWSARQRYEFKYVALVILTVAITVLSPGLCLIAVKVATEKGVAKIVTAALVNICAGLFFYIFNVIKGKKIFSRDYWGFALKFNLPLIPHYLSMVILAQSDKIMIDKFFGEREVAIYSVAYSFSLIMNIVTNSVNSSYIPWTYHKLKENDIGPLKKNTTLLLLGMAAVSLLPVMVAPEIMWIMAPADYAEGIWIIPPISTSVFFTFLYSLFGNIEFYFEKTKFVMVASTMCAGINIVLNATLMPIFGYMAAAYATMICYIIFAMAHYIFMRIVCRDKMGIKSVYDDKLILVISAVYLGCTGLIMLTYSFTAVRYALLGIAFVAVIVMRKKIIGFIKKIKNK